MRHLPAHVYERMLAQSLAGMSLNDAQPSNAIQQQNAADDSYFEQVSFDALGNPLGLPIDYSQTNVTASTPGAVQQPNTNDPSQNPFLAVSNAVSNTTAAVGNAIDSAGNALSSLGSTTAEVAKWGAIGAIILVGLYLAHEVSGSRR